MIRIQRALVSVSDKRGLEALAKVLARHGVEVLSTGGTEKALKSWGIPAVSVASYTGAPEILDGRVKTLHPKIHGGLLGRNTPEHQAEMLAHQISPIDLVVVNLYPFRETVAKAGISRGEAIEQIDIGGPSMLRSAAKNHERVTVVVDPADYDRVIAEMETNGGSVSAALRSELAAKVFAVTSAYDAAIHAYLSAPASGSSAPTSDSKVAEAALADARFSGLLSPAYKQIATLRYGENPHQKAAFFRQSDAGALRGEIGAGEILQGKELSYNNLLDLDGAWELAREFAADTDAACVIVKHTNPCGVGRSADGLARAYSLARECDPVSAFGGVVALTRAVDGETAALMAETFLECIVAPSFSPEALAILGKKSALRLVATGVCSSGTFAPEVVLRSAAGGVLVSERDVGMIAIRDAKVVTKRAPTDDEWRALEFAWRVSKHVKSNAIVFATAHQTVGVGAGQMSRVDAAEIAARKAKLPLRGTAVASDAFFPFRDGLDVCAKAGATAVAQPGGSKKDDEVIAAADEHGLTMVLTGMRHFRH